MEAHAFLLSFYLFGSNLLLPQLLHHISYLPPEMEFMDISMIKVSSLLLYAIDSSFTCRILKETLVTIQYSGF
jgi:hypothetical protein